MSAPARPWGTRLRAWLVLGRVSNLPTVWSNCLAAWLLGGGGPSPRLATAWAGAACVYVGGMFLNDACDVAFDRQHRRERPIPAGDISERGAWFGAGLLLVVGWGLLATLGRTPAWLGGLLVAGVVLYDATHKRIAFSPVVMALCRYLLFLTAGAASAEGINGETMWSALVLGGYIVGLSYVARTESTTGLRQVWPLLLLGFPLVLAGFLNPPHAWSRGHIAGPALLFTLWTFRSVLALARPGGSGSREAVSGLLAGIALVDALAVASGQWPDAALFLGLFAAALALQRLAPAT